MLVGDKQSLYLIFSYQNNYYRISLNVVSYVCFLSYRSGRRIRKTRKYDIITTPAERVEMAPLNEENDDEDDSTLFDVNYRFVL